MAKFRAIINAVRQAITGNATTADVLSGKTFMSAASPNEQTGVMTNNGAVTASLTADGQVYTIPAGYHNGNGKVTANVPPVEPVLLWTNPNVTQNFSAQSIQVNTAAYSQAIIEFYLDTSRQIVGSRLLIKKTDDFSQGFGAGQNNGTTGFARNITGFSNTAIGFSGNVAGGDGGNIPYKIYGLP